MKHSRILFALLLALPIHTVQAQEAETCDKIPQGVEALRQSAASKTEFSLDHTRLVLASKIDSDDEDLRRVIAGVGAVSVHRFHFTQPWSYDQDTLREVKDEYHHGGWKQVLNKHPKDGRPGATDLWIHLHHNAVNNIAILIARANEVTFVEVTGSISPIDLLHLAGHFGIPKIEGGEEVPNQR